MHVNVKDVLIETYNEYSQYINKGRAMVNFMDGFKSAQRRILQGAFEICRTRNVKCATLDGHVVGHYHPHGSTWSTMVNMTREGYLHGKGNFGTSFGVVETPPAASRYPEIRLNKESEKLFIVPMLLDYAPKIESDLGYSEYEYLPSLVPGIFTALSNESGINTALGVHVKCVYPKFSAKSILDFIINHIESEFKTWDMTIPELQFHTIKLKDVSYVSNNEFSAEFNIQYVKNGNEVHLKSILPNCNMEKLLDGIAYKDVSKLSTEIIIPDKDFNINKFKSKVNFNSLAYYESNNSETKIIKYSLLTACAVCVKKVLMLMDLRFKDKIQKCKEKLIEYKKIKDIRLKLEQNKSALTLDSLSKDELDVVGTHRITALVDIDKRIEAVNLELKDLIERSKNIPKEVLDLYKDARQLF